VTVDMREFGFTIKPKTIAKGVVVFTVTNKGTIGHDLQDRRQEDAGARRRRQADAARDVREQGRCAYLCTLPSHAAAGMKGVLAVKEPGLVSSGLEG
jgi:hypothetical protein